MSGTVINLEDERLFRSYDRIGKAILEYISDMDLAWEIEMARRIYFGKYFNNINQQHQNLSYRPFIQWLIFSYKLYSSGSSLIESISGSPMTYIGTSERDTVFRLRNTYESFYKVYSIHNDKILARDIFTGNTVTIVNSIMNHKVKRYYGIFTRIVSFRNINIPIPGYCIMSNSFLKESEKYVMSKYKEYKKVNENVSIRDFINSNSLMIHRYLLHHHL